jgi:hypothetical protein
MYLDKEGLSGKLTWVGEITVLACALVVRLGRVMDRKYRTRKEIDWLQMLQILSLKCSSRY